MLSIQQKYKQFLFAVNTNVIAGLLITLMIITSIIGLFNQTLLSFIPGVFAWLAAFLLVRRLTLLIAVQSIILVLVGISCLALSYQHQANINFFSLLHYNISFITLLVGVSFLRVIASPHNLASQQQGKKSLIYTLIGAHILSSVINLSAIFLVAERLKTSNKLSKTLFIVLTRSFSSAALWSPFFAAMGVALIYSPQASLTQLVLQGSFLTIVALSYSYWELKKSKMNNIDKFVGYPLHLKTLFIPITLVFAVFFIHYIYPELPIVLVIAGLSVVLTVIVCFFSYSAKIATEKLYKHITIALPNMSSELILFLCAGFLSFSVNTLLQTYEHSLPINEFNFTFATALLFSMICLSLLGVHPVISISIVGVWLAPLHPDPNALALVFLSAWSLGMVISPLSGMNVTLSNHYNVSYMNIITWHFRYVILMFFTTSMLLFFLLRGG